MTTPHDLPGTWAAAEASGDTATLEGLLAADFRGIGPRGFVLDRTQWLERFDQGFAVEHLTISDAEVREHGDTALVVGVQDQAASYRGHPSNGRFRISFVLRRDDANWRVLGAQLSGPLP